MTHHNQTNKLTTWFLNLPLDESIDNKGTKFEVQIQDPMKHSLKIEKAKKSSRRSSRRRPANDTKSGKAKKNGKEELEKLKKSKKSPNQGKSSKSTLPLKSIPPNTLNASSPP
jgi:hypothetical protein